MVILNTPKYIEPVQIHSRNPSSKISSRDFICERIIGHGGFGKVYLVKRKNTSELYAMKILDKANVAKRRQQEHTKSERSVLANVRSSFTVELHYAFQSKQKLYLVMEYVPGGELFLHLRRAKRFTEDRAAFYAAEIALALGDLHSHGVIYRDLKPENVLIAEDGHVKLTDFGLAKEGFLDEKEKSYTVVGTPDYLAPEMLLGAGHDKAADWWSLVLF